ncbi:hypothetical protein ACTXT7_003127 [Hymenolepis weldensis]
MLFHFTLQRWSTFLLEYEFNIEIRKMAEFGQPDCLSPLIYSQICPDEETVNASDTQDATAKDSVLMKFVLTEWLKSNQKRDLL